MKKKLPRTLSDLTSVGPATVRDFALLGITTVEQLVGKNPYRLYRQLCTITGTTHDICVQDVFAAAIAQAEAPHLTLPQRTWFYYSRRRKAGLPYYSNL